MSQWTTEDVREGFGAGPFCSPWVVVTQELMDQFAVVTMDPDWMHIDPERAAAEGPFDHTIAFGFWTLSLLTYFLRLTLGRDYPPGAEYGFNYGFDRVRLMAPIPVGSRIRNHMVVSDVREKRAGCFVVTLRNRVELEGEDKPAMLADWLVMLVYPGEDTG